MSKMIQVRNVPDKVHRELVRRAKKRRQTLTAYIEEILENEVRTMNWDELDARIRSREPVELSEPPAETIRREREARDKELYERVSRRPSGKDAVADGEPSWKSD
jgi:hypothetical protein